LSTRIPAAASTTEDGDAPRLPGRALRALGSGAPTEGDDGELVRRMARGDEQALGLLYDRWSPLVYTLAARMLEGQDAEEVVEETFWQAWRQAEQYRAERGTVATWLITIGRSRSLDRSRSRKRSPLRAWEERVGAPAHADVSGAGECPLETLEARERRELVMAALGMLPLEQRQAVELAYYHGLSQSEIARRTGDPLGTVKARVRLAMRKLRGTLAVLRETQ
jgi:RNA polymerase sigma-70 factor, ECF subfamily